MGGFSIDDEISRLPHSFRLAQGLRRGLWVERENPDNRCCFRDRRAERLSFIATDVTETTVSNDALLPQDERADAPSGRVIPLDPDALLYQREASYLAGLSHRTLEAMRLRGGGPPYIKIGSAVRYRRGDLVEWIDAHRRRSTSDPEKN
jgi:predicted DNA-binding transcriptional regulator AlpA